MADNDADKLETESQAAQRPGVTPPPAVRGARRASTQAVPPASTDAFATPSDAPKSDQPQVFSGSEPTIFGGVNPIGGAGGMAHAALPPDPTAVPVQESVPDDDELPPRRLFSSTYKSAIRGIRRSSLLLILTFLVAGIAGHAIVEQLLPQEVYVWTTVKLAEPPRLAERETATYREAVEGAMRAPDVGTAAKALLRAKWPKMGWGFLSSRSLFWNPDAITWLDDRTLRLRVDSYEPQRDQIRLGMAVEALVQVQGREQSLKGKQEKLANFEVHLQELQKEKQDLTADAQRGGLEPDAGFGRELDSRIEKAYADVVGARREVELYPRLAKQPDPPQVGVSDNRPLRFSLIAGVWLVCAAFFGTGIGVNERRKSKEVWKRRQARRPRPKADPPAPTPGQEPPVI